MHLDEEGAPIPGAATGGLVVREVAPTHGVRVARQHADQRSLRGVDAGAKSMPAKNYGA